MAERTIEQGHRAVAQALAIAPAEPAEQPHAEFEPTFETPAPAPAPITAIEDVTIRPITAKPTLFVERMAEEQIEAAPPPAAPEKPFIPPQAERPVVRAPRMPRIDELPIPAQNQISGAAGGNRRCALRSRASRCFSASPRSAWAGVRRMLVRPPRRRRPPNG